MEYQKVGDMCMILIIIMSENIPGIIFIFKVSSLTDLLKRPFRVCISKIFFVLVVIPLILQDSLNPTVLETFKNRRDQKYCK